MTDGQVAFDTVSHAAGSWEDYSNLSYVDDYTVNHNNIYLSGLGAGTTYYYRLRTATQTGDILETGEYSFSTVPCFVADTPVLMADGMKKMIQDVAVGDKVKSWDMDKNELVDTVVEEVWSGKQGDVYAINEDVKATWAHPFWTKEVGWASINPGVTMERYKWQPEELKVGYHIMDSEGGWVEIRSVEALDGEQMTYNLSKVSGHHNYFAHGLLAHNKFCAFLFAKDEKLKEEVFEFVTLGVFEEPGNINSRLVNDRIFEENDGYSYLKLKNNTNKFVLRIPPHQMDYIDYVGLKVVDELNVDKLSERDQKLYKNGKLKQTLEYNLALKDSSSGIELMNKADNRYYKIADEEGIPYPDHVELTFEELPKEDARYTREIVFVEKGYYEPFEGAKIWVDQAPFNQEEWRAWLDKDANEQRLAYILNRETMKHNNIVKLEHQLEGQHQRLNQRFTRQLTTKKISLVVQEARYLTK